MTLPLHEPALWHGGFYELVLQLPPRSPSRIDAAIRAAWSHPAVTRCSVDRALTEPVAPSLAAQQDAGHLHGLAAVPAIGTTVCASGLFCDETEAALSFALPIGALEHVAPGAAGLWGGEPDDPAVRARVDAFLHDVGDRVQTAAPVLARAVGFEVL